MSEWKPVTEPPAMYLDKLGIMKSAPALVYSKYRSRPPEMLIATLQSWGDGATPTWYSDCPEDWNLHDSVLFWMPLPDPPFIGDRHD